MPRISVEFCDPDTKMAQDENISRGNYSGTTGSGGGSGEGEGNVGLNTSSSNGSRSKKVKQKKAPQRGLGVAQLERIREEQQRKEAVQAADTLANNVIGSLGDSFQSPNFRPTISPSPNPMPSASVLHSPPPIDILNRNSCQYPKQVIGLDSISSPRHGNWLKSWNRELSADGEKQRFEHHELVYLPQVKLPYEANNVDLSLPSLPQFQHPLTMVNSPSEFSPASLLSSQMEPPSNQSFRVNNYPNSSTEEDKMVVGMKRPYPFSLESPPAPSIHCNIPSYAASRSITDELASCSNRYTAHMEPRNKHIRESYSNSITLLEPERDSTEVTRDDEKLKGDFLTLASPLSAASPPLNSMHKHLLHCSGPEGQESSDSKRFHGQENPGGQILRLGPSGSTERTFSLFPDKFESDQPITRVGNGNDETIDLNLKL